MRRPLVAVFTFMLTAALASAGLFALPSNAASGPEVEEFTLSPSMDLFVHGGSNQDTPMLTNRLLAGGGRETFMRFDLSELPDDQTVLSATLRMYKAWGPGTTLVFSHSREWDETVTWYTKPEISANDEFHRQDIGDRGTFYEFDLTAGLNAARDEGDDFAFHITRSAQQNASEFASTREENPDWRPVLVVLATTDDGIVTADAEELQSLDGRVLYTDVALPTAGTYGSSISWESDKPNVVSPTGKVNRPTGDEDEVVTLTATVSYRSASVDAEVVVTVRRYVEVTPEHPQIYTSDEERPKILGKIENTDWAQSSFANLKATIDPLADRHQTDPEWITSRMSMYWKEGERYTQVYVQNQNFGWGEGNAPVPTVRLPGMRIWNDHGNAPLADRIPYSEDGSMLNQHGEVVPYRETGHMVRNNNQEILTLAQQAAFLHWVTEDEKYAQFAADIYWQWVLGVYYMNPPLDPGESLGGPGGYEPGGISGYYAYEVIHDIMGGQAAVVYDLLYDYLLQHPDPHAVEIGKDVTEISNDVLKRFIDIGFVRGGRDGNWNINGWGSILPAILALEKNDYYPDGQGREHYLHYYTTESTAYHEALPDILTDYDPVTGLWHEAPGYAFGTITTLVDFAIPVHRAGVDTIAGNDIMQKAALAIIPWLDARGNIVVFGDTRGGAPNFSIFERLLTYYTSTGDAENVEMISAILQNAIDSGQYDRNRLDFRDLILGVDPVPADDIVDDTRTAYSEHHRHITMKNLNDPENGLMATLYGGYPNTGHLSPNGLAMQLYGKGWALSPDAKAYESYWSDDYAYHRGPESANTIVPGYSHGPITVNAMEPAPAEGSFTNDTAISEYVSFSDVTAAEKRRQVSVIRTSPTTGYYVDVVRSDQDDNDYLHHNLGNELVVSDDSGQPLELTPSDDLGTNRPGTYRHFENQRKQDYPGDLNARWTVTDSDPDIVMDMWMKGQEGRSIYQVDAPATTRNASVVPNLVNHHPDTTPTVIVRQSGNAADAPFVSVFEPYHEGEKSVADISDFHSAGPFVGLEVRSDGTGELAGRVEYILSSTDEETHTAGEEIEFRGTYGVVSHNDDGFQYLYLGHGSYLESGPYAISAVGDPVAAGIAASAAGLTYSADADVEVTLPYDPAAGDLIWLQYGQDGEWVDVSATADPGEGTVSGVLPSGYEVPVRVVQEQAPEPSISVDPDRVTTKQLAGDGVTVTVVGLTPGESVTVTLTGRAGREIELVGDPAADVGVRGTLSYQLVTAEEVPVRVYTVSIVGDDGTAALKTRLRVRPHTRGTARTEDYKPDVVPLPT